MWNICHGKKDITVASFLSSMVRGSNDFGVTDLSVGKGSKAVTDKLETPSHIDLHLLQQGHLEL